MDILAHGLWSAACAKFAHLKSVKISIWWSVFWGVFPDLFAFTIPFVWMFWNLLFGGFSFADFPRPEHTEPLTQAKLPAVFEIASHLYNISHSLVIFALVFFLVWMMYALWKKQHLFKTLPPLVMLAWLLHILIDIPTHTYRFYPTPALWPISGAMFDGISWGTPWFMVLNYGVLVAVYLFFVLYTKKSPAKS
ncbi:metal-dependent hydrolase [Candidatus Woesearchaeota archaeon]|nr:metal-dependent hydrolase [Candidatus Woesearchaeota archaeon]